jgi:uncharacterized protein DUF2630
VSGTAEGGIERDVARLAAERTELFSRSGGRAGLSDAEQSRLRAIERQLDECFVSLRQTRAARAASRFGRRYPLAQPVATARDVEKPRRA